MINEFHNREFPCSNFVPSGPGYGSVGAFNRICATVGAREGAISVSGEEYLYSGFGYQPSNKWR